MNIAEFNVPNLALTSYYVDREGFRNEEFIDLSKAEVQYTKKFKNLNELDNKYEEYMEYKRQRGGECVFAPDEIILTFNK
jgi:hypothetical protein